MSSLPTRLGLLLALYLAQGIPFGIYTQALPAILRTYDAPLSVISMSGLLALPWALKVFWSPLVDRHYWPRLGYRRSWILPMNIGLIAVLFGLMWFNPESLRDPSGVYVLFFLLFLVNLFAATQDIATDGLAVRILSVNERGLGNGVQVASYRVGIIIGGGMLLFVLGSIGWTYAFSILIFFSFLLLLPVLLFKEPEILPEAKAHASEPYAKAWVSFFRRPEVQGWIWVLVTFKMAESLASAMVKPMMVDMGMSLAAMGLQVSMAGSVTTIVGAMLGGYLTRPLGRRNAMVLFAGLQAIAYGCYALPAAGYGIPGLQLTTTVVVINALEHMLGGMAMAALLAAVMDRARQDHAGVDFTLQVSLLAVFGGLFYLPAGFLAENIGYAGHFSVAAALGFLVLWPAWRYTREPDQLAAMTPTRELQHA